MKPKLSSSKMDRRISGLLVAAVVLICFSSSIQNGFVYDDHFQLVANPFIKDFSHLKDLFTKDVWGFTPHTVSNNYRPLHMLSYLVIFSGFGLNPAIFHLLNVLLHLGAALLLLSVLRRYVSETRGVLGSILFALHPVQVESVAWIGGIPNLLCAVFLFAAFLFYSSGHLYWSIPMFCLSLFSKEAALLFPVVILVDHLLFHRYEMSKMIRWFMGVVLVLLLYGALRFHALGTMQLYERINIGVVQQVLSACALAGLYAAKWIYPAELNAYYDFRIPMSVMQIIAGVMIVSCMVALGFVLRRNRNFLFGVAWFTVFLMPVLIINAVSPTIFAERYLYLSCAGAALAVVSLPVKRMVLVPLILLCVLFGWISYSRSQIWANDLVLWQDTFDKSPGSVVVSFNLATAYSHQKDWKNAEAYFARTVRLRKDYAEAYHGLAYAQYQLGKNANAVENLKQFIRYWKGDERKRTEVLLRIQQLSGEK